MLFLRIIIVKNDHINELFMIAPRHSLYNRQISRSDLRDIAEQFLEFIDKEKIYSLEDLNQKNRERFDLGTITGDFIEIQLRPSNLESRANTISYIIPRIGIPIEARVNFDLKYSVMIIKTVSEIKNYIKIGPDVYGNLIQNKFIMSTDFSWIRKEIEDLTQNTE